MNFSRRPPKHLYSYLFYLTAYLTRLQNRSSSRQCCPQQSSSRSRSSSSLSTPFPKDLIEARLGVHRLRNRHLNRQNRGKRGERERGAGGDPLLLLILHFSCSLHSLASLARPPDRRRRPQPPPRRPLDARPQRSRRRRRRRPHRPRLCPTVKCKVSREHHPRSVRARRSDCIVHTYSRKDTGHL